MTDPFKALRIYESESRTSKIFEDININDLPEGDVLIKVKYSSLNYKDALSANGNKGVTREYPHTPGIDAAGVVESGDGKQFHPGDEVVVTGKDLGMNTHGGFSQYIRVPASWVIHKPDELSLEECMMYGTAGLTAAASVYEITQHMHADEGKVLVTGTSGGVGSFVAKMLLKLNYQVVGVAGSEKSKNLIHELGVKEVISREEANDEREKPLFKPRWHAVSDNVGGKTLETAIKSTFPHGIITSCGNIAGAKLDLTVYPFILRGIRLQGIDSAETPIDKKKKLWEKLSDEYRPENLSEAVRKINFEQLPEAIDNMLSGTIKGRTVIRIQE